jgi:hypothetical protein
MRWLEEVASVGNQGGNLFHTRGKQNVKVSTSDPPDNSFSPEQDRDGGVQDFLRQKTLAKAYRMTPLGRETEQSWREHLQRRRALYSVSTWSIRRGEKKVEGHLGKRERERRVDRMRMAK